MTTHRPLDRVGFQFTCVSGSQTYHFIDVVGLLFRGHQIAIAAETWGPIIVSLVLMAECYFKGYRHCRRPQFECDVSEAVVDVR